MAPRSTLLLALCACTSAAPALNYIGCGQTSNGFQATVAVTKDSTSKTLVDPDVSGASNYTVVFTNGGKQTTVAVQDGLATLTQYTGASVTAQLQNGGTDIGTVYQVPALATTTCIKLADYVGCGFSPKTTSGSNGVQATLSNPNAPAEGTSVVYSPASVTAGHLLECNTCSPTTGCHKGGTASIVSVPGVLNKPGQYVHTKSCKKSDFTFANGSPVFFGTGARASPVDLSNCLTLPKVMGCGEQPKGTFHTGQNVQVQLYHKAPPSGARATYDRAVVHYGFQQLSVTCEDCSESNGCHVGSGADVQAGYSVTTIPSVPYSPLNAPQFYARVCANSTALGKVFGTGVLSVKIKSPSTQCLTLPKLMGCGGLSTGHSLQVQLYHKAPPSGAGAVNDRAVVHYSFQQLSVMCEDCSESNGCHVGSGAEGKAGYGVTTVPSVLYSPSNAPKLYARVCANSTAVNKFFGTGVFPVTISSPSAQCVPLPKLGTCSKFAAANGGKSTYSWSFTGPIAIAYQPTMTGSLGPLCNNCAPGNSRGCVLNANCNDPAKCCTKPGAIGAPASPLATSVFNAVGCQPTKCSTCTDAAGNPLYASSGVLSVSKKSLSCATGTQDAANGGCAQSLVTTTAPPSAGGSDESLRLGLGLGLGLGLPALGAVAYIGHRRSLASPSRRAQDSSMIDASPSIQRPPAAATMATNYAEMND